MEETMRKVSRKMNFMMSVVMSLVLCFIGHLFSGHFSIPDFLISSLVSLAAAQLIRFLVPVRKIHASIAASNSLDPEAFSTKLINAAVSDLIYTPVITLCVVYLAWKRAVRNGIVVPFLPMFLQSLVISLLVGYVLIFILEPVFFRRAMEDVKMEQAESYRKESIL